MIRSILLMLLLPSMVFGQNGLEGIVIDDANGETMIGVHIYFDELHKGTVTNANGKYHIGHLPKGEFDVQFSFLGYATVLERVVITDSTTTNLEIRLEPVAVEPHEVVVSAGFVSAQDDNAIKIETIDAEDLERSGGMSVLDVVAEKPGVSMISTGPGIAKPVIRGLSGNRVLVVYDGIRIENQQWGDEHGMSLDWMGVDRVEVIKGPASLLYGSDAMGGVINFIDEKPAPDSTIKGSSDLRVHSNTAGYSWQPAVKGASHRLHWGFNGMIQDHADYLDGTGTFPENTGFSSMGGNAKVGYHNDWGIFKLNYRYLEQDLGIMEGAVSPERRIRKIIEPYQEVKDHFLLARNTIFLNRSRLKWYVSYQENRRKEFEEGEGLALDMQLETLNYDLRFDIPMAKRWQFISGAQGMWQTNENFGEEQIIPNATTTDIALYSLSKFDFDEIIVHAGVRWDMRTIDSEQAGEVDSLEYVAPFSRELNNISASLGGTFHLSEHLLLRSNTAIGFRAPNLAELASNGVHEGTNRYEKGDATLDQERNLELDLSVHYHSDHINAEVSVFLNSIENFIFIDPTDSLIDAELLYNYTAQDASLIGLEAGIDLHPHPLDWVHWVITYATVNGQQGNGSFLPLIPSDVLTNTLQFEGEKVGPFTSSYFKISLRTQFAQIRPSQFETWTPAYNIINAGIGGKLNNDRLFLGLNVQNLLDENYIDHLSRFKTDRIRNMGRNVSLHIKWLFG